jgi:hypothetical protein
MFCEDSGMDDNTMNLEQCMLLDGCRFCGMNDFMMIAMFGEQCVCLPAVEREMKEGTEESG